MKTKPIGPFLGVNNRLPDSSLGVKDGYYLKDAVNVDILLDGTLRRRRSADLLQAMGAPHSLGEGHMVRASTLYRVTLPTYAETLVSLLSSNAAMSYARDGDLYCTNGTDALRIASNGTAYPWGLPTPNEPPVTQIAGSLSKGWYQVAVAYYNATTGEEGGVSASTQIAVSSDNAGLRVTIPAATTGATHVNVFVSTLNGSVVFFQRQVAVGGTTDITTLVAGREAVQRYEAPMPAGSRVFFFNGRMCVVSGKTLYYGLPFRHGYYLPVEGRIDFTEDIAVAIGNQGGIYVATASKTYFFAGLDPSDIAGVSNPLPYGAIKGTEFEHPRTAKVGWLSAHGFVVADKNGEISTPMAESVDLGVLPASGYAAVLDDGDMVRVVSCGWCMNLETGAATRYDDFDFTSISGHYGTAAGGIYRLDGSTAVRATVDFGKHSFGSEGLKHMPALYLGGEFDGPVRVTVTTSRQGSFDYAARSFNGDLRVQRVDSGRGLRDNWYNVSLSNDEGFDFKLATVSTAPVVTGRRI